MNDFPKDHLFEPESFTNSIKDLSNDARKLYGDWILDLCRGKTFFLINVNWLIPSPGSIIQIPDGYDRYVFSFHVESWYHSWLKEFCESHPNQEIVVISEYPPNEKYYPLPNLKVLVFHCWWWLIPKVLKYDKNVFVPVENRSYHLSSLVNKPSFFKALTTAYLMRHNQVDRVTMSWNINDLQEICGSLNFLDLSYNYPDEIDDLIRYYHKTLKNLSIRLDQFNNTRFSNFFCQIPQYTQTLVNVTNETYQTTISGGAVMPGPFITEKTWKPLLSGSALLPQSMPFTYRYLENFGFQFDYPWDREFDLVESDFDRYIRLLRTIDKILEMDFRDLAISVRNSNLHNFEHIRSVGFIERIKSINQEHFEDFMSKYK